MSINPQDKEVLSAAREKLLEEVDSFLSGQKYIAAVLTLEDIIGISNKIGDLEGVNEHYQKIAESIERFRSIDDDIEILGSDESLKDMIKQERSTAITAAQQAAKDQRIREAIQSYERAIEFSLKLSDKKNIWKLSKIVSLLKNKLPSRELVPPSPSTGSQVQTLQKERASTLSTPQLTTSTPDIVAPVVQPTPPAPPPIAPVPQITPPIPQPTPPAPPPIAPVPQITPPIPQPISPVPQPSIPIPSIQTSQSTPTKPISTVEEAASILGAQATEEESDDSFLDNIVDDLQKQPQIEPHPTSGLPVEKKVPFIPKITEPEPPVAPSGQAIPFAQAPVEQQGMTTGTKELIINEVDDKKIRKKMMLAEKVALKKLQDAEKQFEKVAKKTRSRKKKN